MTGLWTCIVIMMVAVSAATTTTTTAGSEAETSTIATNAESTTDANMNNMSCPEGNAATSIYEQNMAWFCELVNWRNQLAESKERIERICNTSEAGERWQKLFECPDFSNITCNDDSSLVTVIDLFNCSIMFCADGVYSDQDAILGLWRQHFYDYKNIYAVSKMIQCRLSGCTEPSATTTDPMDEHSTEVPMTTMMPDAGGGPTTQPISYTSRHPSMAVVDDTTPLTFPNSEATSTHEAQTDMTTMMSVTSGPDDKEWTVFQRRIDGSVDFNREWTEYANSFGNSSGEFWLGLENVHQLTKNGDQELRIDMITTGGDYIYAHYSSFGISSSADNYILSASGYSGNATDALAEDAWHNNVVHQPFSTSDRDNDNWSSSCAIEFHGAWWFNVCFSCHLNGRYHGTLEYDGIIWINQDTRATVRMRATEMKFRPK